MRNNHIVSRQARQEREANKPFSLAPFALLARNASVVAAAAMLTACAIGPDYVRPETPVKADFHAREAAVYAAGQPLAAGVNEKPEVSPALAPGAAEFWRGFNDPLLTRLVEQALAANTDLRVAVARVDRARAITRQSRLDLFPTVAAEAGYAKSRASADQAPGVPREQRDSELGSVSADAFWELDLFGRVRRGVESQRAEAEAAAADLQALQVSIAAEVARTYFELRGEQEQLRIAQRNADNQRDTVKLTQARLDAGRGTELDTSRARAQLEFTLSRVPALETAVAASAHRLAVLNGREPAALLSELEKPEPMPALPQDVAVGTPAELLRRRPDLQAAERRLESATARVGIATADLFPRLTFNGAIGGAASNLGDIFTRDGETYGFGPRLSWAFLDLGRVRARIAATDADAQGALAAYEGAVLRALEESENALTGYARAQREGAHLGDSAAASERAAQLARLRFEGGAADFLQVLDAERSLLDAQDRLAQNHIRAATTLVAVYKAVAGGWPERTVVLGAR